MKVNMYSVYDQKTLVYSKPHCAITDGQAIRDIMDAAEDKTSMLAKHPEDYVLVKIGAFDDSYCTVDLLPAPEILYKLSMSQKDNSDNEISNAAPIQPSS